MDDEEFDESKKPLADDDEEEVDDDAILGIGKPKRGVPLLDDEEEDLDALADAEGAELPEDSFDDVDKW